jgi:hypothetical protein
MRGVSSRGPSDRVRALSVNSNTEDVMLNSSFRELCKIEIKLYMYIYCPFWNL